jgi:outer membrane protein
MNLSLTGALISEVKIFRLTSIRLFFLSVFILHTHVAAADVLQIELTKALEGSDSIAAARQNLRAAVERIGVAKGTLALQSTLSVSGESAQSSANDGDVDNTEQTDVILSVKKPLYDGGVAGAETHSAMLDIERARIRLQQVEQAVLQEALAAFINLVAARDRVGLEEANISRLEEYLRVTQIRLDVGEATPTDLSATKARFARARASLITAQSDLETAAEGYKTLMGVPPLQLSLPPLPENIPETVIAVGDAALSTGLSHRLARIDEKQALASLEKLTAQVRPTLDAELRGKSTEANLDTRDSEEVSVNLTFSMPIFPNSAVRAAGRAAVADHRASVFSERDSARTVRLDAENALRRFLAQNAVIEAHEAELEAAMLFRDGTKSEADFGLKTVLDVLDAEQDVVSAEVSLLFARRDRINASYAVLASIGKLTAETLAISGDALSPDEEKIPSPIRLRPLPTLAYPK